MKKINVKARLPLLASHLVSIVADELINPIFPSHSEVVVLHDTRLRNNHPVSGSLLGRINSLLVLLGRVQKMDRFGIHPGCKIDVLIWAQRLHNALHVPSVALASTSLWKDSMTWQPFLVGTNSAHTMDRPSQEQYYGCR
jgi:hypothetical protein